MTNPTPPYAALDGILRRARHLILDFDGPVCSLYAHEPARLAADGLRAMLAAHTPELPSAVATTADPLAVLADAAGISPQLAEQADAELTRYELSAAATAQPAGYSHDVIASAREGHRTITVISTCSARAVRAYLDRASLDELVGLVNRPHRQRPGPSRRTEPDWPSAQCPESRSGHLRACCRLREHSGQHPRQRDRHHCLRPHASRSEPDISPRRCNRHQPRRPRAATARPSTAELSLTRSRRRLRRRWPGVSARAQPSEGPRGARRATP